MSTDPFAQFKVMQREGWSHFAPLEAFTTMPAAALVRYAGIRGGQTVLDVACGTGPVAVTAARAGAKVCALDLTPALLEHGRRNAKTAGVEVEFTEGDAEALPYPDTMFDVVVSQFGHMFAPRPDKAIGEMLRVLRPGGRIAFSTWPHDQFVARAFALTGRYAPPPPPGSAPPSSWGDPNVVTERLGSAVKDLQFDRDLMLFPCLSPQHYRQNVEATAGPVIKLVAALASDPARLQAYRSEVEALASLWFADNAVRQHYLMTRATKL
ncbi:MAG TPA: class I SAM-dependent methyltransferase [Candidatus Polarisedimenticolia bacterium]|jgi:SAM-dependent methyltransferase|nr:class I SAM-dependent methyltransferase [Candidatus Polarisedimenticolia bacterium]